MRTPAERWAIARRVLLVRLDNLGDVLMTTPAMAAVRESLPQARLTLLGAPNMAGLHPHLPMLDAVMGFAAPWMKAGAAALSGRPPGDDERAVLRRLMDARFDAAVIFTVCTQSALPAALLCRMAGIPLVLAHVRERAYGLLSDEVRDDDRIRVGMRHEVQRQLDLVAHVGFRTGDGRLRFHLRASDRVSAQALLRSAGLSGDEPYVLLHPGASASSRRYPPAAYAAAAGLLQREGVRVLVCAGPGEGDLLSEMREAMGSPCTVLPVPAEVGTLAALVAGARVLVANNSGPVHLAAAVGTPVVDLYALTNPQHTPWQVPARVLSHDVPCRNCQQSVCAREDHACLRGVAPHAVAHAAQALMRETA